MNEEPKNIWKRPLSGRRWLGAWLIAMAVVFLLTFAGVRWLSNNIPIISSIIISLMVALVLASVIVGLAAFLGWLCCWKNFRRFFFVCACLLTLIALGYAEEDLRAKHALNKFEAGLETKGEKFDLLSIVPPTVPDDQNFAMAPIWVESIKATLGSNGLRQWFGDNYAEDGRTDFVDRLSMPITDNDEDGPAPGNWQNATPTDLKGWQGYYRTVASKTNLFPVPPSPQTPAQDVLLALSKYDPAIEELRQASALPYARFPVDYAFQPPAAILLPHLAMLRRVEKVLDLRSLAELQNGQSDKALADLKLTFRLIDSVRGEPFLISHLVRIAMWRGSIQTIYEGLANHQWSEAQLADLDSQLAKMDFLADYEYAITGEQTLELGNTEYLRRTGDYTILDFSDNDSGNNQFKSFVFRLLPGAFFYQNELTMLRMNQEYAFPMVDVQDHRISPRQVQQYDKAESKALSHFSYDNVMVRAILPSLGPAVKRCTYAQETVDLARVAIALERYRLATGVYPDSLDELAPHFLPEVPHDIIDSLPLHYHKTNDGRFILYSVGWNETDDGGRVLPAGSSSKVANMDLGDWVWRYPAQ